MLVLTVYIVTFVVGFPANVFTFTTLAAKAWRHRLSPSDLLLLNLTAADLLLLLFLPFKMAEAAAGMVWPLPAALCPVANFCFYSSIYLSSLFLAALSVRRYLGVAFPLRLRGRGRLGRVAAASAVLWLLACSHCSIVFVASYHGGGLGGHGGRRGGLDPDRLEVSGPRGLKPGEPKNPNTVEPNTHEPWTPDHNLSKAPSPNLSNTLYPRDSKTYPNLFEILNPNLPKTSNLSFSRTPDPDLSKPPNLFPATPSTPAAPFRCYDDFSEEQLSFVLPMRLELFLVLFLVPFGVTVFCYVGFVRALMARSNIPRVKRQRAVGLAVVTMVNFGLCFAPYNLSHVVGFVQGRSPPWRVYATLLSSLNAALDPFIFYFSSGAVRGALAGVGAALLGRVWGDGGSQGARGSHRHEGRG
ncbi:free fatty acid receptor 3-like [Myiozetetes cayanensis]|nr:free fatty acid receptor 3-like [Myiozetetes cayanensis]